MSKRAEQAARKEYNVNREVFPDLSNEVYEQLEMESIIRKHAYKAGYEQAEKDISALIESRIKEILGDAQPKPILRMELQELITKIKQ